MSDKPILKELCRYRIGTFADIIYRNALLHADEEAFVSGLQRITFSQFNARINRVIRSLHRYGVRQGEAIGILSWNCLEYAEFFGAAMKGGFIASPFNPRLHPEELEYLINDSEARTLFVGPELLETVERLRLNLSRVKNYICLEGSAPGMISYQELLSGEESGEPDVDVGKNDPVIILYTSGTTGLPRGALYTHAQKLDNTRIKALGNGNQAGRQTSHGLAFFPYRRRQPRVAFFPYGRMQCDPAEPLF